MDFSNSFNCQGCQGFSYPILAAQQGYKVKKGGNPDMTFISTGEVRIIPLLSEVFKTYILQYIYYSAEQTLVRSNLCQPFYEGMYTPIYILHRYNFYPSLTGALSYIGVYRYSPNLTYVSHPIFVLTELQQHSPNLTYQVQQNSITSGGALLEALLSLFVHPPTNLTSPTQHNSWGESLSMLSYHFINLPLPNTQHKVFTDSYGLLSGSRMKIPPHQNPLQELGVHAYSEPSTEGNSATIYKTYT